MKQAASAERDLAKKILAYEGGKSETKEARGDAAAHVFEKLRLHLSKLVGIAGFQALLTRSRALAEAEVRWLAAIQIMSDGALEGISEIIMQQEADAAAEGSVALLGHLLGLLITFIGKDLTLRLVQDIWPDAALNDFNAGAEETPE